jgi:hypothetical protein
VGGWAYVEPQPDRGRRSATYVKAGIYAPFNAGAQLLAIDDNGKLIKVVSSGSQHVSIGTVNTPLQNPVMHQQSSSSRAPTARRRRRSTTARPSPRSGHGPAGKYAAVFVNRTARQHDGAAAARLLLGGRRPDAYVA